MLQASGERGALFLLKHSGCPLWPNVEIVLQDRSLRLVDPGKLDGNFSTGRQAWAFEREVVSELRLVENEIDYVTGSFDFAGEHFFVQVVRDGRVSPGFLRRVFKGESCVLEFRGKDVRWEDAKVEICEALPSEVVAISVHLLSEREKVLRDATFGGSGNQVGP
jgi:hypothetical protein